MIISLYAGGMTIRDIQHHLASTIGTDLSHETISNITDVVSEEVVAWQIRALEEFYPVVYLDAIRNKIRKEHSGPQPRRLHHCRRGPRRDQARVGDPGFTTPRDRRSGLTSARSWPTEACRT